MTGWKDGAARSPRLDTSRPNIARVYDYWLGGKDNFRADREEAERLLQIYPDLRRLAWENRQFLRRAVHWLAAECGIRQFLDVGSGLPTASNTHNIAQAAAPDAKVAYVDKDPVVVLHADALLADGHDVVAVRGDAAEPAAILADPRVNTVIQPGRPYAIILAAVLHFFPLADARRIVTEFAALATPGSYLIISVGSSGSRLAREYTADTLHDHSLDEIRTLLTGLDVVDPPGLVDALYWAPRTLAPASAWLGGHILAAVARTPGGPEPDDRRSQEAPLHLPMPPRSLAWPIHQRPATERDHPGVPYATCRTGRLSIPCGSQRLNARGQADLLSRMTPLLPAAEKVDDAAAYLGHRHRARFRPRRCTRASRTPPR